MLGVVHHALTKFTFMKKNITLFVWLLILSISVVNGQDKSFDAPKKSNLITVSKKDTALQFLLQYARHLQDFGFSVDRIDKELLSFSTDFKTYKFGGIAVIKITVFARQNGDTAKLEIKGKIEVSNADGGKFPYDACNCGLPGDARKNAFKEMLKTLESFPVDKIEFIIK